MSTITTVGTLIEHEGEVLTLLRSQKETSPGTWGLAAGRLEEGEEPRKAAVREIQEETGHRAAASELESLGVQVWHQPSFSVHFHAFRLRLRSPIEVRLDPEEHEAYDWKTPEDILKLDNPIPGLCELIKETYFSEKRA